jgi:hypothetical protein
MLRRDLEVFFLGTAMETYLNSKLHADVRILTEICPIEQA